MKRIRFNNISIRSKLVWLHLFISLPILAVSLFFLNASSQSSYDNMRELSYTSTRQLASNMSDKFYQMYDISERILLEGSLRNYVSTHYQAAYDSYTDYIKNIKPILDVMSLTGDNITLEIYSNNPMMLFSPQLKQTLTDLNARQWYKGLSSSGKPVWLTDERADVSTRQQTKKSIGFYRYMQLSPSRENGGYAMALAIMIPETDLHAMISQEASAGRQVFLVRDDGVIVTGTQRENVFCNIEDLQLELIDNTKEVQEYQTTWQNNEYLTIQYPINIEKVNIRNWTLVYMVPMKTAMQRNAELRSKSLWISLLCILISLLAAHMTVRNFTGRVNRLSATIQNAWNEKFNLRAHVTGTDEIGRLETNFNAMLQKIDLLREEVFQTSLKYHAAELQRNQILLEKREAEITALHAQIHPHYLFNTLEAIKMNLLVKRDVEETVDILTIFSENFRFFIDTSTEMVALREELYFLRNYIAIQKYVHGDTIRYSFSISEDVLDIAVPKLILQPLVENALYHGVLPQNGGMISVCVEVRGDDLFISVTDNGMGIDSTTLQHITTALENQLPLNEKSGRQIALSNISRRLKILYAERCTIQLESEPGKGTSVFINIKNGCTERM